MDEEVGEEEWVTESMDRGDSPISNTLERGASVIMSATGVTLPHITHPLWSDPESKAAIVVNSFLLWK